MTKGHALHNVPWANNPQVKALFMVPRGSQ